MRTIEEIDNLPEAIRSREEAKELTEKIKNLIDSYESRYPANSVMFRIEGDHPRISGGMQVLPVLSYGYWSRLSLSEEFKENA